MDKIEVVGKSDKKNQPCDVIKMREFRGDVGQKKREDGHSFF